MPRDYNPYEIGEYYESQPHPHYRIPDSSIPPGLQAIDRFDRKVSALAGVNWMWVAGGLGLLWVYMADREASARKARR